MAAVVCLVTYVLVRLIQFKRSRALTARLQQGSEKFLDHLQTDHHNSSIFRSTVSILVALAALFPTSKLAFHDYVITTNWNEGDQREFLGDHVGALLCYRKAVRVDPNVAHTHLLIGACLLASGRNLAAIPELKAATNCDPGNITAITNLAYAYTATNQNREAADMYRRAAIVEPFNADIKVMVASCEQMAGHDLEAYRAYQDAIAINGRNVTARLRLAAMLIDRGAINEGIANCLKAIAINSRSAPAHYCLAQAYARTGNTIPAIQEYWKVLELDPTMIASYLYLAELLEKTGRPDEAVGVLTSCIALQGKTKEDLLIQRDAKVVMARVTAKTTHRTSSRAKAY